MVPVAQHDLVHFADRQPIHEHVAARHPLAHAAGALIKLDHLSVLHHEHVVHVQVFGQPAVQHQVTILAVDRHEVLGLDQVDHHALIVAVAVP